MPAMRFNHRLWFTAAALVAAGVVAFVWHRNERVVLQAAMLRLAPDKVLEHPDMVALADARGPSIYRAHCASCHGADMKGNTHIGAPNLTDNVWLYGTGRVLDIEQTVLYGIRSGHGKSHNMTDMPAFGARGLLKQQEMEDVIQYVLALNGRPHMAQASVDGRNVYAKADCSDCHGPDAKGESVYGAPDLTANVWNNGGDTASLFRSIYSGLHHVCPAWIGKLSLADIRDLAVYLHSASRAPAVGTRVSASGP
jgi:cytochrome c oxidase cbb3-type subunit III